MNLGASLIAAWRYSPRSFKAWAALLAIFAVNFAVLHQLGACSAHLRLKLQATGAGDYRCTPVLPEDPAGGTSISKPYGAGPTTQSYSVRRWSDELQWDLPRGAGPWTLHSASVVTLGYSQEIPLERFRVGRDAAIQSVPDGLMVTGTNPAGDPQLVIRVNSSHIFWLWNLILVGAGALFSAALLWALCALARKEGPALLWAWAPGVATILIGYWSCGKISVNGGNGWDGAYFHPLIRVISSGNFAHLNGYTINKIGSYPHIFAFVFLGLDAPDAIDATRAFNLALMASSLLLVCLTLSKLGISRLGVCLGALSLSATWPVFCAPFFNPILCDHMALFLACAGLWAWSHGRTWILLLLLLWSFTVMPLLPVALTILLVFPRHLEPSAHLDAHSNAIKLKLLFPLFATIFVAAVICVQAMLYSIPESALLQEGGGLAPASIATRGISIAAAACLFGLAAGGIAMLATHIIFAPRTVSWRWSIAVAVVWILYATIIAYFLRNRGTTGFPPLVSNLLMQAQMAPLKQLVAHAYHHGFVFASALIIALYMIRKRPLNAIGAILVAFGPLLVLGSESRQFEYLLPIACVYFSSAVSDLRYLKVLTLGNAVLLLPALYIESHIREAEHNAPNGPFSSSHWQYYFGRQGPWMSMETYACALGASALVILALVLLVTRARSRSSDQAPAVDGS